MSKITKLVQIPQRRIDAHKGDFGKVCVIGGSRGMAGAVAMSGIAALKTGAGLVTVMAPLCIADIVAGFNPCYMTKQLMETEAGVLSSDSISEVLSIVEGMDVIVFGPGIGQSAGIRCILRKLLSKEKRIVIDADGLNNLAKIHDWHKLNRANLILTPHPGEFKRLWKGLCRCSMPEIREEQAVEFAKASGATIVLKGAGTIVSSPAKDYYINDTGNPGMATPGSGDVLAGMVGALWAQFAEVFTSVEIASLAVYLHGLAGDIAAEKIGQMSMLATDIIEAIPKSIEQYKN